MRAVAIIGVGSTPFGRMEGSSIVELAVAACGEAEGDPERLSAGQALVLASIDPERGPIFRAGC